MDIYNYIKSEYKCLNLFQGCYSKTFYAFPGIR